jgi:hypothetical protein
MGTMIRILIVLVTAVVVFVAMHYLIQTLDVGVGTWKYCLVIGFGVAIIPLVWRLTSPKTDGA